MKFKYILNEGSESKTELPERVKPKNNEEFKKMVRNYISVYNKQVGPTGNLNFIDTSDITDMSGLFEDQDRFWGDISEWDTSKVTNMHNMFNCCSFNGDISKWDVSNVRDMGYMFDGCHSLSKNKPSWYKERKH